MEQERPYQIVTFLGDEPTVNEAVYYGENGWYPQLAIKRRFSFNTNDEDVLVRTLRIFFANTSSIHFETGELLKPERMPVRVIDIPSQDALKLLHLDLIKHLGDSIVSRYPDREGENYYAHITAEYNDEFVIPVEEYTDRVFSLTNVWLLKDVGDENSLAYVKIR